MLQYNIEVRDINGNLFVRPDGCKVTNCFKISVPILPELNNTCASILPIKLHVGAIEAKCRQLYMDYSAIALSPNVDISVSVFNNISQTWMELYSFYGKEQRFVIHS